MVNRPARPSSAAAAAAVARSSHRRVTGRTRVGVATFRAALAVACGAIALTPIGTRGRAIAQAAPPSTGPRAAAPATGAASTAPATVPATAPATGVAASRPALLNRPVPKPVPANPNELTDEKVGEAIRKGAEALLTYFDPKTHKLTPAAAKAGGAPGTDMAHEGGMDALCVYALMQAGLALGNKEPGLGPRLDLKGEEMLAKIEAMAAYDLTKGHPQSYAVGLRATALALYVTSQEVVEINVGDKPSAAAAARGQPGKLAKQVAAVREALMRDAAWCIFACDNGAYGYQMPVGAPKSLDDLMRVYNKLPRALPPPKGQWDNSTSQYGLLGAWSAAEAGVEIPTPYWFLVDNHWRTTQLKDGQWAYHNGAAGGHAQGTISMVCAGLASMLVTHEYVDPAQMQGNVGREPFSPSVKKGLAWFEQGNNSVSGGGGYTLYGVERVGLASGFKHFGTHDWYKELAARAIAGQNQQTGGWGTNPVETAYHVLFLARGRHPIMMNKLRFDGSWANRPRDAANLAKFTSKVVERPLNWQVVNLATTDWTEWTDSPVLTLASHEAPKLSEADLAKIRGFVEGGGVLFTQADGASPKFNAFAAKLAKDLWPQYPMTAVPPTHPLFSTETLYAIKAPLPPVQMVSNGARILMLHAPADVARWWQQRDDKKNRASFQLGINLFFYAAGKRDLRNRIISTWVPAPATAPIDTVNVARLEYGAPGWDPEPGAWRRYANWFHKTTGTKLDVGTIKLADLKPLIPPPAPPAAAAATRPAGGGATKPAREPATEPTSKPATAPATKPLRAAGPLFVHLTGVAEHDFTPADAAALKAYVESGGVVLIDATGGPGAFEQSAGDLLKAAFPGVVPAAVGASHPILVADNPGSDDLTRRRLRPAPAGRPDGRLGVYSAGKGHVIFSPLDVTSGLLGHEIVGVVGYEPAYAQSLVRNIIFWMLDGQKK